jgi:hypothetical protein
MRDARDAARCVLPPQQQPEQPTADGFATVLTFQTR